MCVALVLVGFILGIGCTLGIGAQATGTPTINLIYDKVTRILNINRTLRENILGPYGMKSDVTAIKNDVSGFYGVGGIKSDVASIKDTVQGVYGSGGIDDDISQIKTDIRHIKSELDYYCN